MNEGYDMTRKEEWRAENYAKLSGATSFECKWINPGEMPLIPAYLE